MSTKTKYQSDEQPVITNAWMVTLGDLLTLLVTFFVLRISLSGDFNHLQVNPNTPQVIETQTKFKELAKRIQNHLEEFPTQVDNYTDKIIVNLPIASFSDNSNELNFIAVEELNLISKIIAPANVRLTVNVFSSTAERNSITWEDLGRQALAISRQLIDAGIDPQSISAMGSPQIDSKIQNQSGLTITIQPII